MWQTCYNRCISNDNERVTTAIITSDIHPQSLSTVTMSTNSSILALEEDTRTSSILSVSTSSAGLASLASVLPDTNSCRKPLSYVSAFTLSVLWHLVYWTSQALTWFAFLSSFAVVVTLSKDSIIELYWNRFVILVQHVISRHNSSLAVSLLHSVNVIAMLLSI